MANVLHTLDNQSSWFQDNTTKMCLLIHSQKSVYAWGEQEKQKLKLIRFSHLLSRVAQEDINLKLFPLSTTQKQQQPALFLF